MGRCRCSTTNSKTFKLLRLSKRDPEAFGAFYRRHERLVFGYFVAHAKEVELAADLMAETFAAALKSAPRFRAGPQPATTWLMTIAHHKLVSSIRRGIVETRAREKLGMAPVALLDASLERAEAQIDEGLFPLEELLAGLPPDQRDAIQARVLDERGYADIGATLGCSEAVIRKRVSRGLRTLRSQLEGDRT